MHNNKSFYWITLNLLFILLFVSLWNITKSVFIGGFIAFLIEPIIDFQQSKKIPRSVAILNVLIIFIALFMFLILVSGPLLYKEVIDFNNFILNSHPQNKLDQFLSQYPIIQKLNLDKLESMLISWIGKINSVLTSYIFKIMSFAVGFLINSILLIMAFYYYLKDKTKLKLFWLKGFTLPQQYQIESSLKIISHQIRAYFISLFILGFLSFLLMLILLPILQINYVLLISTIVGIISLIPYLGPMFHMIIIFLIQLSYSQSWIQIFTILAIETVFYTTSAFYIQPLITRKIFPIHPMVFILTTMIGGYFGGITGILLAIPLFIVLNSFIQHFFHEQHT